MTAIYPYQTQEVRDLAWACFSPMLLHIAHTGVDSRGIAAARWELTPDRKQWLQTLDRDPAMLLSHLNRRPTHRLGLYFENLWHFFLQQDPDTELISHNLPVHDQGKTLGEFDCIYYCHQRQCHVHLELAVKYFLGTQRVRSGGNSGSLHEWLGPDNRDRLDLKLNHLLQHQILLSTQPQAKTLLRTLGITTLVKEIAIKGYLFQPLNDGPTLPPGHQPRGRADRWISCDQLPPYLATLDEQAYLLLPKMKWLSAAHSKESADRLTRIELQTRVDRYFNSDKYPLLIAALDESGLEAGRFFVVPLNWPNH